METDVHTKSQISLFNSGSHHFLFVLYIFCFFMLSNVFACKTKSAKRYSPEFSKAVNNEQLLFMGFSSYKYAELFTPFAAFLNRRLKGTDIHIVANNSLVDFEQGLDSMKFDFAFVNPGQALKLAEKGYNVFAKLANDKDYRGVIVARKDAGFTSVSDLKFKTIGFTSPHNMAGTKMPLYFLHQQGINIDTEIKKVFIGPPESILMNVFLRKCDAGAVWYTPWRIFQENEPDIAAQLEVKWETPSLVNMAFIVKKSVKPEMVQQVSKLLLSLQTSKEGLDVLKKMQMNDTFIPATSKTYKPVKEFMRKYNRIVIERSE